jgi:benzodiazapine receptor
VFCTGCAKMGVASVIRLIVACGVSLAAGAIGSLAVTDPGFNSWYAELQKPGFMPPSWVFGPVWTVLYLLMGVAAFLVWQRGLGARLVRTALLWFLVQLALNAAWTPVFFGLHRIGLALVVIALLWAAILVTMYYFFRVTRPAGMLLVPYLLWVSFAAVLNAAIWHLNR